MADFLTSLAARSLEQLASVQPRRASRFERPAAAPDTALSDLPDGEEATESTAPRRVAPVRTLAGAGEPCPPAREAAGRAWPGAAREDPSMSPTSVPIPDRPSEDDRAADRARYARPMSRSADSSTRDDQAGDTSPPWEPVVPPSPQAATVIEPEATWAASRRVNALAPDEPRAALRAIVAETGEAARGARHVARPDEGRMEEEPRREAAPAPRITVSIGRVEVRVTPALPPARPTPRPAPPQPQLSLGEYLQRSQRGRP